MTVIFLEFHHFQNSSKYRHNQDIIQASVISNLKYDSIKKMKLAPNPPIFWDFEQYVTNLTKIQEIK